jgi:hypothetical protein
MKLPSAVSSDASPDSPGAKSFSVSAGFENRNRDDDLGAPVGLVPVRRARDELAVAKARLPALGQLDRGGQLSARSDDLPAWSQDQQLVVVVEPLADGPQIVRHAPVRARRVAARYGLYVFGDLVRAREHA